MRGRARSSDRPYLRAGRQDVDPANHAYDLDDFYAAVKAGNFPAVSYIKMPAFQDGHAGYSDPLDEQAGNVELINFLQQQPDWQETAVIVTYDDSDGWYDHAFVAPTSASYDPTADQLNGAGICGLGPQKQPQPNGLNGKPVNGRCGPGTRVPFLVISPYAKKNFVSHTLHHAGLHRAVHRRQLAARPASRRRLVRRNDRFDHGHVRLRSGHCHDFRRSVFLDPTAGTVIVSPPDEHHHH